jgi:hypothetical protein
MNVEARNRLCERGGGFHFVRSLHNLHHTSANSTKNVVQYWPRPDLNWGLARKCISLQECMMDVCRTSVVLPPDQFSESVQGFPRRQKSVPHCTKTRHQVPASTNHKPTVIFFSSQEPALGRISENMAGVSRVKNMVPRQRRSDFFRTSELSTFS